MGDLDTQALLTILLVAAVGVIAYLVGERRAMSRALREKASAPPTAPTLPTPSPPAAEGGSEPPSSAPANSLVLIDETVSSPSTRVSAKAPQIALPTLADAPVKLYEEEEDEVDPTRVAAMASAPPSARVVRDVPIRKFVFDEGADVVEAPSKVELFLVSATAQTDKGVRRKRNEDCLGILEAENLFVVADGMGGYAGGDRASRLAVETLLTAYRTKTFEGSPHEDVPLEASELARAIQMANATIGEAAQQSHELRDMGTTVVAAVFSPSKQRLCIGHIGDSRCYRLRDGVFTQLTADHTMAEEGVKGPESAKLSRAVGIWPVVLTDIVLATPRTGDVYLLCSDGLTKMLSDDVIGNVLRAEEEPKAAVERLIFFANSRGGKDNITVILVRVVPVDWRPDPSEPFRPADSAPPPPSETGSPLSSPRASASVRVPPPSKKE